MEKIMRTVGKLFVSVLILLLATVPGWADRGKMDQHLQEKAQHGNPLETVPVIVQTDTPADAEHLRAIQAAGGKVKRHLSVIKGVVVDVPVKGLDDLARHPRIKRLSHDAKVRTHNAITNATVGADIARGLNNASGAGIGVAVIDTGIASWLYDIKKDQNGYSRPYIGWVDFVNGNLAPYDDNGHGTHIAGIIGGSGYNSEHTLSNLNTSANFKGIAPDVQLVGVKALDQDGVGTVSNIIAGIEWCLANQAAYNIRVINLSLGHPVIESYKTDPLTQTCEAAVNAGIVVCVAAGNYGKNSLGLVAYGGITSPGNDPMVITVGATKSQGTPYRSDDTVTSFSSRGPTYIDQLAKPDLVAPGNKIISVSAPSSTLYNTYPLNQVSGYGYSSMYNWYFTLSGTSMATPVVSGAVALMLQVNPTLTPNLVKAILMYTAQDMGLNRLTQGAGYLNVVGALNLAANITQSPTNVGDYWIINNGLGLQMVNTIQGQDVAWGGNVVWGEQVVLGNIVYFNQAAWAANVIWGTDVAWGGNVVWGEHVVQGTDVAWGGNVVWGELTWTQDVPLGYETLIDGE